MKESKDSPLLLDAYLLAIGGDLASAADRRDRFADELPIGDEKIVINHPVTLGKFFPEGRFALFRALRPDIADPV